ncbi:hypothetical protein [Pseudomonas frederiksbergensis]|uniref:Uncharacterized protein n=1 Tax=Pseudomonas frederiksbergensis TaxID=104087 RepID=A0A423KKN2_9PSED|nr:hypothetical protein [Pseudomonas frederiksbergensis]RON53957.1 hypothetical protein BK665_13740 [Pseudomonas frederiksbergensis]
MNAILLDVIKVGFHGAAIVMALLTARLLHQALNKWGPEVKNNAGGNLAKILKEVRVFMMLCFALFAIGVSAEFYTPSSHQAIANLMVTPSPWPEDLKPYEGYVTVSRDKLKVEIIDGFAQIEVGDKENIRIGVERLVNKLGELNADNKRLLPTRTPMRGFGE